ncbi:Mobile element protein (plasmid) [Sinorhizobium fredii CCBAU 83666]|nr:Mobile element protein [Sinorhizobium fredii CCBAU 83666]
MAHARVSDISTLFQRGMAGWHEELIEWLQPFLAQLRHKRRRQMCPAYVAGLIGPGDRKSVQPMAAAGERWQKVSLRPGH